MGSVRAANVFTIEPLKEVTQTVQATTGCQSIAGNVTIVNGVVDFYVTDTMGATILYDANVSVADFSFNTTQIGAYVFHLANRWSTDNLTAILYYGRNFAFVETSSATVTSHTVTTWEIATTTSQTIPPPIEIISPIEQLAVSVASQILVYVIGTLIALVIASKIQKWKDGSPSKTPSTIKAHRARQKQCKMKLLH
ncbi:MAG: hypothetical protein ABR962_01060 [Candidatus Bathyarchaeia archaeon]